MQKLTFMLLCFLSVSLFAETISFFPENNRKNPIVRNQVGGITEAEFHKAIKIVSDIYVPWIEEHYGKTLEINGDWEDSTVNAWIKPTTTGFYIQMFGGLARDSHTTLDGFYTVIFHELGHAIGGAPKYARYGKPEWASSEGQSDYYATAKAAKIVFDYDILETLMKYDSARSEEESFVKAKCDSVFEDEIKSAVCFRSALGGISLGNLLASLSGTKVDIQKPSTLVVTKTNVTGYPANQCRLDTYFRGALCNVDALELPSMTDAKVSYCNGTELGARPTCWYKE